MREHVIARVAAQSAGDTRERWESVISAAEQAPDARVPGSRRQDQYPELTLTTPIAAAAVLVPIVERMGALSVLLTRRNAELNSHAGQISFPGGRAEPDDLSPADTALRETEEEVGILPGQVAIAGRLDNYLVGTGFRITPIVGMVTPPAAFRRDAREVAEIFEVPLSFVLSAENYRREAVEIEGRMRRFYVLSYRDYDIWGATAAILVNLQKVIGAP